MLNLMCWILLLFTESVINSCNFFFCSNIKMFQQQKLKVIILLCESFIHKLQTSNDPLKMPQTANLLISGLRQNSFDPLPDFMWHKAAFLWWLKSCYVKKKIKRIEIFTKWFLIIILGLHQSFKHEPLVIIWWVDTCKSHCFIWLQIE